MFSKSKGLDYSLHLVSHCLTSADLCLPRPQLLNLYKESSKMSFWGVYFPSKCIWHCAQHTGSTRNLEILHSQGDERNEHFQSLRKFSKGSFKYTVQSLKYKIKYCAPECWRSTPEPYACYTNTPQSLITFTVIKIKLISRIPNLIHSSTI